MRDPLETSIKPEDPGILPSSILRPGIALNESSMAAQRRNQRLYRGLVAADRISDQERQDHAQVEREDEIICKALSTLTGTPAHSFKSILSLCAQEPDWALRNSFGPVLPSEKGVSPQGLKDLRKAVADYDKWIEKAKENPIFVELAGKDFDTTSVHQALLANGARYCTFSDKDGGMEEIYFDTLPEGHHVGMEDMSIEGSYHLLESMPSCFSRFSDFATAPSSQGKVFLAWAQEISDLGTRFIGKLRDRLIQLSRQGDGVLDDKEQAIVPAHLKKFLIRSLAFSEATIPAITALRPLVADIRKVQALGMEEVFDLLDGDQSLPEVLSSMLPRVEQAISKSSFPMRQLVETLKSIPQSERYEIFDAALKMPEILGLIKITRQYSLEPVIDTIYKFQAIFDANPETTKTIFTSLYEIDRLGDRKRAIAYALTVEPSILLDDSKRERLFDHIRQFPKFHLIMPQYIGALAQQNELMLGIIATGLEVAKNGEELQVFAKRLASLSPSETSSRLASVRDDQKAFVVGLLSKKFGTSSAVISNKPVEPRGHLGTPWIEQLISDFECGKIPNRAIISASEIQNAFDTLPADYRSRLRRVWQNSPEVLTEFCADVIAFHGQEWFDSLILDSYLFGRYREKLIQNPVSSREHFEVCADMDDDMAKNAVREWLAGSDAVRLPDELKPVQSILSHLPENLLNGKFSRIVIWGRFHSEERRQRLAEAAGEMPLILHDTFDPRLPDKNGVLPGDFVLCVTKSLSHKLYYGIKRHALSKGATLVCTAHEGTNILGLIITKIAQQNKVA